MPQETNTSMTEELIKALQDNDVRAIFGGIFDERVKALAETVDFLFKENERKTAEITKLSEELAAAKLEINDLEAYNRRDNLIICGLPVAHVAEATSAQSADHGEHMDVTEQAVLELCQTKLNVQITKSDISIAHRLGKKPRSSGPPAVIVRFATRKAREAVYAARCELKKYSPPVFINEDLTKPTAALFSQARKLVSDGRIYKAWTNRGSVYYKPSNQPNCKPVLVRSLSELP